jgi:hypothetical protein
MLSQVVLRARASSPIETHNGRSVLSIASKAQRPLLVLRRRMAQASSSRLLRKPVLLRQRRELAQEYHPVLATPSREVAMPKHLLLRLALLS